MILLIVMFVDPLFRVCKLDKAPELALLVYYLLTTLFLICMGLAGVYH